MASGDRVNAVGADLRSTRRVFETAAGEIGGGVSAVKSSPIGPQHTGRHFHAVGDAYKAAVVKVAQNIKQFGVKSGVVAGYLESTATEYESSDQGNAAIMKGVR